MHAQLILTILTFFCLYVCPHSSHALSYMYVTVFTATVHSHEVMGVGRLNSVYMNRYGKEIFLPSATNKPKIVLLGATVLFWWTLISYSVSLPYQVIDILWHVQNYT